MMTFSPLQKFQNQLQCNQLDGYILCHGDAHLGEYVTPHDQALSYITGFTGSAGFCLITPTNATLFVDSRYTIQAEIETRDNPQIQLSTFKRSSFEAVFHKSVPEGARVISDPWIMPQSLWSILEKALPRNASLTPDKLNLLGQVWSDRPQPPKTPLWQIPDSLIEFTTDQKIKKIQAKISKSKADWLITVDPHSVCWLLNHRGDDLEHTPISHCFAAIPKTGMPKIFSYHSLDTLKKSIIFHPYDEFQPFISSIEKKTIVSAPHLNPAGLFHSLKNQQCTFSSSPDPLDKMRTIKSPTEINNAREAHRKDGIALIQFYTWLFQMLSAKNGHLCELSASKKLTDFRKEQNRFWGTSFSPISGFAHHGAIVHYRVSAESSISLRGEGLYLLDSGAQYFEGTTDVTRTILLGQRNATAAEKKAYTAVLKGLIRLSSAKFPAGTTGQQLDALARYDLWQNLLDYGHGTGHGVGSFLSVHEAPPSISPISTSVLEPGMIISIEPGYYETDHFGIRLENLALIKELGINNQTGKKFYGFETLTLTPFDARLIDFSKLTDAELFWLKNYHKKIKATLFPHLKEKEKFWLSTQLFKTKR